MTIAHRTQTPCAQDSVKTCLGRYCILTAVGQHTTNDGLSDVTLEIADRRDPHNAPAMFSITRKPMIALPIWPGATARVVSVKRDASTGEPSAVMANAGRDFNVCTFSRVSLRLTHAGKGFVPAQR